MKSENKCTIERYSQGPADIPAKIESSGVESKKRQFNKPDKYSEKDIFSKYTFINALDLHIG